MERDLTQQDDFLEKRLQQVVFRLFGEMDASTYAGVRPFFKWLDLPGGDYLFRQGSEGKGMYILASGRLKVLLNTDEGREAVAEIPACETVGEMALITGEARTADVLAMRDCVLARLEKADFEALVQQYPKALLNISKTIIERLQGRHQRKRRRKTITNICVLPISDGLDAQDFAERLCVALGKFGSVLLLGSGTVNQLLGKPDIAQASPQSGEDYRQLSSWLEEREAKNRFVVYLPDAGDSEWTRRCIRHADEVLLLGDGQASPAPHPLEQRFLLGQNRLTLAGQTLVLLHPPDQFLPQNTRTWLAVRDLAFHHHIRRQHEPDMARLARFLSGNAVGLVLSGGAARGAAHVGVFRALEEAGIPVDVVGGTSIGAIMGAVMCMGWSAEVIRQKVRTGFLQNPTSDFNLLPRVSIFKGKKLDRLLQEYFGNIRVEDLWLSYYCLSCNLSKTNPHVHRSGHLEQAIRASISIPGVFPPAELNDELYVDGGVFDNMPVDVMNKLGIGSIIAVDLQNYHRPDPAEAEARKKSTRRKLPNLLHVVMEASMLSGRYLTQEHRKDVDIYINPPMRNFGLMDWQKFDRIEEAGYQHAKEVLQNEPKNKFVQ
ncbi:MAG: patatin-like phospholipase family protein [Saprospiraceae bacterium]